MMVTILRMQCLTEIARIEERLDSEFENTIEETGMSIERFQELSLAIQYTPELMQRVQVMIQESAEMQQEAP
jgi:DNA mismatch repair ATPase MutL